MPDLGCLRFHARIMVYACSSTLARISIEHPLKRASLHLPAPQIRKLRDSVKAAKGVKAVKAVKCVRRIED